MSGTETTDRKHGVTPGLSDMNANRQAGDEAAFFLRHLTPGMNVLDCGCGPGSITVGIARAVAPGRVVGIDHDPAEVTKATQVATELGITNVEFQTGDVYRLRFPDASFDAAHENSVFIHLERPVDAAREIGRVLKDGGVFGARDTDADGWLHGNADPLVLRGLDLFLKWHASRGSNLKVGKHLPAILRDAGFEGVEISATFRKTWSREAVHDFGSRFAWITREQIAPFAVDREWATPAEISAISEAWSRWAEHPDSFSSAPMCEAVGWKSPDPLM